jgi:alpha-L-glutamate ligase-like protein
MKVTGLVRLVRNTLDRGVVGMNFRNRHLVDLLNPKSEITVARDKAATKARLHPLGIPTARTIALIRRAREIPAALDMLTRLEGGFVVKPAKSAQGRGIILCRSLDADALTKTSGEKLDRRDLIFHLHRILHGEYSFGRPDDLVLIEELLVTDNDWVMPDLPGAPDLRIKVCEGKVLMGMVRLPTKASDGRANLHCGAAGTGIDLETGMTTGGILNNRPCDYHPDNGLPLAGHLIQDFPQCIELAIRCANAFRLGYIGIDLMRDKRYGPVVLEVNARPGLAIQIANRKGFLHSM